MYGDLPVAQPSEYHFRPFEKLYGLYYHIDIISVYSPGSLAQQIRIHGVTASPKSSLKVSARDT